MSEKSEFVIAKVLPGTLNALVKNIMKQTGTNDPNEAVRLVNSGEWVVSKSRISETVIPTSVTSTAWAVDSDGNIHFKVVSNGMTGEQWEKHFKNRGFRLSDWAQNVLRCANEAPTDGVIYNVVVRPGKKWSNGERITKNIRSYATEKDWKIPHWEVACFIRDAFTDKQLEQMGLWYIVTMHEPIVDSAGVPHVLCSRRFGDGRWFHADYGRPSDEWDDAGGFAFVVSQLGSKT